MPIHKKIIKISKEDYNRLKADNNASVDLYIGEKDNSHKIIYYAIGTKKELRIAGISPNVPYY